jgi:hypothetical protein
VAGTLGLLGAGCGDSGTTGGSRDGAAVTGDGGVPGGDGAAPIGDGSVPRDGAAPGDGGAPGADGGTDGGSGVVRPAIGSSFQWQLTGNLDTSVTADVFDIDLFDHEAAAVAELHAKGAYVICYLSVGSYEDWRPDANDFPAAVLGNDYEGWAGEKWLDIRRIDLLGPIMKARLDLCQEKGFDGVEPDNMEVIGNDTGFPLTADDEANYARWLAQEAHARGLSIGIKNTVSQVDVLQPHFDWALTEDCFDQGWCGDMSPFVANGKPVFMCEYTDTGVSFSNACAEAASLNFTAILKNRDLDAWLETCP